MDVRNCKSCGKLFNYLGGMPLCPSCSKLMDEKFEVVKAYIYDHPGAGIQEVSEENDVTVPQIRKWIKEERLSFAEDSPIGIECEGCGVTIKTGRFCNQCKSQMANTLSNVYASPRQQQQRKNLQDSPKMRYLNE